MILTTLLKCSCTSVFHPKYNINTFVLLSTLSILQVYNSNVFLMMAFESSSFIKDTHERESYKLVFVKLNMTSIKFPVWKQFCYF